MEFSVDSFIDYYDIAEENTITMVYQLIDRLIEDFEKIVVVAMKFAVKVRMPKPAYTDGMALLNTVNREVDHMNKSTDDQIEKAIDTIKKSVQYQKFIKGSHSDYNKQMQPGELLVPMPSREKNTIVKSAKSSIHQLHQMKRQNFKDKMDRIHAPEFDTKIKLLRLQRQIQNRILSYGALRV